MPTYGSTIGFFDPRIDRFPPGGFETPRTNHQLVGSRGIARPVTAGSADANADDGWSIAQDLPSLLVGDDANDTEPRRERV